MSFILKCMSGGKGSLGAVIRQSFCPSQLHLRPSGVHHHLSSYSPFVPLFSCQTDFIGHKRPLLYSESYDPWSLTLKRYRWRHKLVRAPPTKPLSFDYSGDQTMSIGLIDLKEPKLGFENVDELKDVDENVKKIFSLEFDTKSGVIKKLSHRLLEAVKDHPLDLQSLEVKIASDTVMIRNGIEHCLRFRNDKITKSRLIKRIVRRRRMLRDLKSKDIEKFDWITAELKLKYVEPSKFDNRKISKKGVRKKIARDAALDLQRRKMEELRKKLDQEKVVFEKYRDEELTKIETELKELGINQMNSIRDTLEALSLGDLLPKPEKRRSRRWLLLEKKFELYGERKKVLDEEILKANGFLTDKEMPYLP